MSGPVEPVALDRELLGQAIGRLRDRGLETFDVHEAMQQVVTAAIELFGLTGAGLMIIDDEDILRFVLATDEGGALLESVQEEIGEGPCVDSLYLDTVVTTVDAGHDPRWPELGRRLEGAAIGGVLGVPVRLAGGAVAALNVYLDEPHEWEEGDVEALSAFGRILETVLATAVLADRQDEMVQHLQAALDNRVEIERAVGLLMGRHGINAVVAFNRLRSRARSERRKVVDLARILLAEAGGAAS